MSFKSKKVLLPFFFILFCIWRPVYSDNSEEFSASSGVNKWLNDIGSPKYKSLRTKLRLSSKKDKKSEIFYFLNTKRFRNASEDSPEINFPMDRSGHIDWALTVRRGFLNPMNSINLFDEDESEHINGEYIYHNSMHIYWLTCDMCHPKIFPMEKGGTKNLTMQNIFKGEFCGRCHGKVAFSLRYCKKCHSDTETFLFKKPDPEFPLDVYGMIDWVKAVDSGMIFPAAELEGSPAKDEEIDDVVIGFVEGFQGSKERTGMGNLGGGIGATLIFFPHAIHSYRLSCNTCHPKIFAMQKGATKNVGMAGIAEGKSCGKCHGKVAFPIKNCARCHPKLKKTD